MSSYVPESLRRLVIARAEGLCEYCLIHEEDTFFGCEVDHIISEKHGGPTNAENLAYACFVCNHKKGSDIGSILWRSKTLVRLFNPRTDLWNEHFLLKEFRLEPISDVGEVTARLLGLNEVERVIERQVLGKRKRYPGAAALARMRR